jgi:hypothetical protein
MLWQEQELKQYIRTEYYVEQSIALPRLAEFYAEKVKGLMYFYL